jgi:hypothetical protein
MTKNKIEDIRNIAYISGFGKKSSYEKACQDMLQSGFEWLVNHKKVNLKATTYKGVYGILEPKGKDAIELSNVIVKSVPDCTGAMHHCVMNHLIYISKEGLDKWKQEVKKKK